MKEASDIKRIDFPEFLATEEQNLLVSIVNMRHEFDLFFNLDSVYKEPLFRLSPKPDDVLIAQLYFFVHFHLFVSVSNLLRLHLSEALGPTRKAIDGGLTAYELILRPNRATEYLNQNKFFVYIKNNIKDAIDKDASSYPLAKELIEIHELCSQFGSHADIATFVHRMQIVDERGGKTQMLFDYFQKPKNDHEFRFYFLSVLHAYFLIFRIFKEFFDRELRIVAPNWEARIKELGKDLLQSMISEQKVMENCH